MSNASPVFVAPAPVHIAAPMKKEFALFNAEKVETIVRGMIALDDNESVKPSFIKMNKEQFRAGMGGKASPVSFITSLLWGIAAHAWGQGKLAALQEGLPPVAQFALVAACDNVKNGGGIDALTLRHAALHAWEKVQALPLRPKAEKPALKLAPAPVAPVATSEQAPAPVAESASIASLQTVAHNEAMHDASWAAYGDALLGAVNSAKREKSAPEFVSMFKPVADNNPAQAFAMLEQLAAMLGYGLVALNAAPVATSEQAPALVAGIAPVKKTRVKKAA